jgi:hypothetical protein
MRHRLAALPVLALLAACAIPSQPTGSSQPLVAPTPAAWMHAEQQADRFDHAFRTGGMSGVAADIDDCYAAAMRSRQQIAVRDCLVYDDFADRFAAQMNRQAGLPVPPFFQPATVYPRLAHYSGPAGFNDAQIMSGYMSQGSNAIFAVIASRTKAPR